MRLDYRILWFDDQPNNAKPVENRILTGLARLGFEPEVTMRAPVAGVEDPLTDLPDQSDVDLVLMDWRLGGSHDGAKLARRIRQKFRDTDIIFYSSESPQALRKAIFDEDLDGVHCVNRTELGIRTISHIQSQMRKVLDLNHMRGIVMAATSDLDQAMIDCLEVVQAVVYPADAASFAKLIGEKVATSMRSKADDIEKLGNKGRLDKLLKEPAFGAAIRLTVLQAEIEKIADKIRETHLLDALGRYAQEVITPRNDFAHRRASMKEGKLVLEGRNEAFDQNSMIQLRLKLLSHADNLQTLLAILKEMAEAHGETALADQIEEVEKVVEQAVESVAAPSPDFPTGHPLAAD
ncbi:hypothetical protein DM806_02380 [Sphingobium lactosutens]|uniref:response regulator n=1 Tax=Sphingobium lactosutens TaxID=522773 RepID=UPI0015C0AE9D|nr:response regulator [Sphingobium lactosutens]NWK94541.1 hypothetical protein [Sphingobium lactosutens]